jgi:hypothetical protein
VSRVLTRAGLNAARVSFSADDAGQGDS